MNLPNHKCGLYLHHNEHKDVYETAQYWIENDEQYQWKDDESKQRAIDTDEIWVLQWYPETPVGFHAIAAPTLEELLEFANEQ